MNSDAREPFVNARFRVEIDGLKGSGATEVIFPEARIVEGRRKTRVVQYSNLTLRRGLTSSGEWYQWWERARVSSKAGRRTVSVVLMDAVRADVARWTFLEALPSAYTVSPLNALGGEALIETLEVSVHGMRAWYRDSASNDFEQEIKRSGVLKRKNK
jgi:phage tail-like protein